MSDKENKIKAKALRIQKKYPLDRAKMKLIGQLWIQSEMMSEIAERAGMSVEAVDYHLHHTILPAWRRESVNDTAISIMKVRMVAQIAYNRWANDPEDAISAHMLRWAIDREIRIFGHESPSRIELDDTTAYRVAGQSQESIEAAMLERLAQKMQEMRGVPIDATSRRIEGPTNGHGPG